MRTMFDAVTPSNIPSSAAMVAGYVDGRYAWHAADWARFPNAVKVRIAVFSSTNDGNCLDIERGDATPQQGPNWVAMRRAAGVDPSVYCSLFLWPTVRAAFRNANVAEPHYWIAAYPGNGPNLYPGSYAHQYANPGPVDISVVADYWPGIDPRPVTAASITLRGPFPLPTGHGYTIGSTGWGVREIQALVKASPVDGLFGPITASKVLAWTAVNGPYKTAVVNQQVWDFMAAHQW